MPVYGFHFKERWGLKLFSFGPRSLDVLYYKSVNSVFFESM